jgi:hypothetical protein
MGCMRDIQSIQNTRFLKGINHLEKKDIYTFINLLQIGYVCAHYLSMGRV